MTVQDWRKVKRIFGQIERLSPSEQTSYLDRIAAKDPAIRQEVEGLLAYYDRSSAFLGVLSSGAGQSLAHYKIQKRLGEGGMGLVYLAEDTRLGRKVAIKALPPWAAGSPLSRARLLEEARCASALNHPNIITIYEILQEPAGDFIVMEYLVGRTLKDLIPPRGLETDLAVSYALVIADALDHAHQSGIVHRDLKPSNIFVSDNGRVKLLDFGLAIPLNESDQRVPSTGFWGTAAYVAPERDHASVSHPRLDVFSFGIVFWEMLTGRHPFVSTDGALTSANTKRARPVSKRPPSKIPPTLLPILQGCMEREFGKRISSMATVREMLQLVVGATQGSQNIPAPTPVLGQGSAEFLRVRAAIRNMNYASLARSRKAAAELRHILQTSTSDTVWASVARAMRDLLVSLPTFKTAGIPEPVRETRRLALDLLKVACDNDLCLGFETTELEHLDLWYMDFSGTKASGLSFRGCFLVDSTFRDADLTGSVFDQSFIRNVKFDDANLTGADFSRADWFNAIHLTEHQLRSVRPGTLMKCPPNESALHRNIEERYVHSIGYWPEKVREELFAAWREYLAPGGLRDIVNQDLVGPRS